ncbi:hypothetical protein IQ288_29360 [Burkholderia sp. R-69980]|nr:hypothetical protein [Burkholderia sp. R-69980]
MNDHSLAGNLLSAARDALLEELLPALPASRHYDARMVANAMAIAARDVKVGDEARRCASAELLRLAASVDARFALREVAISNPDIDSHKANEIIAKAIRQGRFDRSSAVQMALTASLIAIVNAQLRITNPKVLSKV